MSRVTLTNPFDLLGDENEDRTNVPTQKKEQKPAAPAAKPAAKPAAIVAKPVAKQEAKAPAKPAEAKTSKPSGGNSDNQTVRPNPPRDSNQNLQERDKETRAPRDKRDRPPKPAGEGKRVFDRQSGTGRPKNEQSRGGRGRGNWGGETDPKEGAEAVKEKEAKVGDEKEEGEENKEEKPAAEGEKKEGEAAKEGDAPATPKEKEETTYEEYLKNRKGKAPNVEAHKPRQVTDTDFGGFVPLTREDAPAPKKEKKAAAATPATDKAAADKAAADKAAADKKEAGLAAKLLTFASHQDAKRQERSSYRNYDDNRRPGNNERKGAPNPNPKGPRGPRPERGDNKGANAASQPPVQAKDFPALGPHGSESVKA